MEDFEFLHQSFNKNRPSESDNKIIFCDRPKIIILEDDASLGQSLKMYLEMKLNAEVILFASSTEFLENFQNTFQEDPFCFLTDISLGAGHDGLFLLDLLTERRNKFFSLVMTGFASIETAINATKRGVFHYLTKPFDLDGLAKLIVEGFAQRLKVIVKSDLTEYQLPEIEKSATSRLEVVKLEEIKEGDVFQGLVGKSAVMHQVFERILKIAQSASTVLVTGESGTGKELVARAIHRLSPRYNRNLVSVNCGAIPGELLESELFGHVKGAFTGAVANRRGRFELAHEGTIFLDEIGDMAKHLQVKILRVLQAKQIELVGSSETMNVNCRVIAATHRDLDKAVAEGKFREDLYYRLNVIPVRIPSLKERKEDIPLLISYFLKKFVSADKSNMIEFSRKAFDLLVNYEWPGNVRELENMIERLVILKGGQVIIPQDLPSKVYQDNPLRDASYKSMFDLPEEGVELKQVLSDIEDSLIIQAINRTSGNKNKASRLLGLNRTTLIEKIKKKNLNI